MEIVTYRWRGTCTEDGRATYVAACADADAGTTRISTPPGHNFSPMLCLPLGPSCCLDLPCTTLESNTYRYLLDTAGTCTFEGEDVSAHGDELCFFHDPLMHHWKESDDLNTEHIDEVIKRREARCLHSRWQDTSGVLVVLCQDGSSVKRNCCRCRNPGVDKGRNI